MKLEKWALIAEITSGIAIVATLIFLIIEIRGNSAAVRASTLTSISERTNNLILSVTSNPAYVEAFAKQTRGEELSIEDEFVLANTLGANVKLAEESFIAFRDGHLEEEVWLTRAESVLDRMARERDRAQWAVRRDSGWYVQGFADFIDAELALRYGE